MQSTPLANHSEIIVNRQLDERGLYLFPRLNATPLKLQSFSQVTSTPNHQQGDERSGK
jgi:hypothetical protein